MKTSYKLSGIVLICVLALFAFKNPSQDSQLLKKIIGKLSIYNKTEGPEKTYLHTDKDFYTNGETIWFKTYLIDGITHAQSNKSKVVYVELVDAKDSIVAQRKIYSDALGASGDIQLGKNIRQGNYQLRSYTKYMLNDREPVIFQKEIPIVVQRMRPSANLENFTGTNPRNGEAQISTNPEIKIGKPNVRFFPEGGSLVEGIGTALGIEITDGKNNGITLKGVIKDNEGKTIVPFESLQFGLGKVNFKPEPQKTYYASIEIDGVEQKFELPEVNPQGYGLSIKNRGDHMILQVAGNSMDGVNGTLLVGHLRGKLIFKRVGKYEDKDAYGVKLFNKELLDGVAQFTLFAPNGEPVCERLVFVDSPSNDAELSITSNAKSYGPREKVSLEVALTDTNGIPLSGDFSMGVVTSNNKLENKSNSSDIRSWLLLDSDLGGSVPDAGFFFENDSEEKQYLLDALMLTHGWRRFVWSDMLNGEKNDALTYQPEKGIMVTGKTTVLDKPSNPKKTNAALSLFAEDLIHGNKKTDDQGKFSFGPFVFTDSIKGIVQALDLSKKGRQKQKEVSIFLDSPWPEISIADKIKNKRTSQTMEFNTEYLKQTHRQKVADFRFDPKEVTRLDEVVVAERKKTREEIITEEMNAELTSGMFSRRVYIDSISGSNAMSALDLLRRFPGIQVFGIYPFQTVQIRGPNGAQPLFLLDGVPTDIAFVQAMRAPEVMFIDMSNGPDASIFGSRAAGGVVSLYSNRGFNFDDGVKPPSPGINDFILPGFYKTREFYTPNYADSKKEHEKPDYRTTLFWEPDMLLNDNGSSTVDFYTGDSSGNYMVKVEGMTDDGRPISGVYTIDVEESD